MRSCRRVRGEVAYFVLPRFLVIFSLARSPQDGVRDFYSTIVQQLFVPTVAALIALVFGVSAFGDEREDGTILYLVATPQPRVELVIAKVAAAWTATLALVVPSLVLSGVLALGAKLGPVLWQLPPPPDCPR